MSAEEPTPLDELPRLITMQVTIPTYANGAVQLATNLPQDCSLFDLDCHLDKLIAAAERQRAITQLPGHRAQRDKDREVIERTRVLLAEAKAGYEEATRLRQNEIKSQEISCDRIVGDVRTDWERTKREPFDPRKHLKGFQLTNWGRHSARLAELTQLQKTADNEHQSKCLEYQAILNEHERTLKIAETLIAEFEAKLRREELTDVADLGADLQSGAYQG